MRFVLATNNPKKLTEMAAILESLGVEGVSPKTLGIHIEVEETGTTFAENAMLKAKAICEAAKLPAIADDSGLCVDALNGGPGVYSARYGGEGLDDERKFVADAACRVLVGGRALPCEALAGMLHGVRERMRLRRRHPAAAHRHRERRHLVVWHVAARVGVDQRADLLRRKFATFAFPVEQQLDDHVPPPVIR